MDPALYVAVLRVYPASRAREVDSSSRMVVSRSHSPLLRKTLRKSD